MILNNDEEGKKVEFLSRNTETFQNVTMLDSREVWDATRLELHWKALKCKSVKICEDRLRIQREIPEISRGTIYFTSIFSKRIDRNNVVDSMNAALFHYRKSKMNQPKWRIVKIGKLHCHYLMRKRLLKNIGRVLLTAISQTPLFANSSNRSLFLIMKGWFRDTNAM